MYYDINADELDTIEKTIISEDANFLFEVHQSTAGRKEKLQKIYERFPTLNKSQYEDSCTLVNLFLDSKLFTRTAIYSSCNVIYKNPFAKLYIKEPYSHEEAAKANHYFLLLLTRLQSKNILVTYSEEDRQAQKTQYDNIINYAKEKGFIMEPQQYFQSDQYLIKLYIKEEKKYINDHTIYSSIDIPV